MSYVSLVIYGTENDYAAYFQKKYCAKPLPTFDGIDVVFTHRDFNHAFYESSSGQKKNIFSKTRARRIDWIEIALKDPKADLHVGWDSKRKRIDVTTRVAIVAKDYVVVIKLTKPGRGRFKTAYVAGVLTISKIKSMPKWPTTE